MGVSVEGTNNRLKRVRLFAAEGCGTGVVKGLHVQYGKGGEF